MEPLGLAWTSLWQIFVGFRFYSTSSSFIHTYSLTYNTTTMRPALEDSPSTGLTLGGGLLNQWRCGREGTFCHIPKCFCVFSNMKFILNCLVVLWFIHNKWVHRAPTLTWFRSLPCGKDFAWI